MISDATEEQPAAAVAVIISAFLRKPL